MSSKEKCAVKEEYDLVAPDGGWGYVICAGAVVIFLVTAGFLPCFGMIYKDLIDEIGMGLTEISLSSGINAMSFALCGFLTSALLQHMTKRQLALFAITIFNIGTGSMVFVKSVLPFFFWLTLQGAGFGILFNITFTYLNEYFVEKSLFAISLVQTTTAVCSMFLPQFAKVMYDYYGYRGSILMITAICMQGYVAVALFQPVEWHMKKVPKKPKVDELQVLLTDDDNVPTVKLNDLEAFEKTSMDKSENEPPIEDIKKSSWMVKILKQIFDVPVMKIMIKTNMSWCNALQACCDMTFSLLLPQALFSIGWSADTVALAITLVSAGDLAGRVFFTIFSKWIKLGSQEISVIGLVLSTLSKLGLLFSTSKTMALVFIASSGISRSIPVLFLSLMVNEAVGPENFAAAMGFSMMLMGTSVLAVGPVFGVIRDYTGSYNITIAALSIITALCSISWAIELLYKRWNLKKKKENM